MWAREGLYGTTYWCYSPAGRDEIVLDSLSVFGYSRNLRKGDFGPGLFQVVGLQNEKGRDSYGSSS